MTSRIRPAQSTQGSVKRRPKKSGRSPGLRDAFRHHAFPMNGQVTFGKYGNLLGVSPVKICDPVYCSHKPYPRA